MKQVFLHPYAGVLSAYGWVWRCAVIRTGGRAALCEVLVSTLKQVLAELEADGRRICKRRWTQMQDRE